MRSLIPGGLNASDPPGPCSSAKRGFEARLGDEEAQRVRRDSTCLACARLACSPGLASGTA